MAARILLLAILLALAVPAASSAQERSVLAPYRFQGPAKELTPIERERATVYRNQLQRQQLDLDRADALGRVDPVERRSGLETQTELNRMNDLVRTQQTTPTLRLPATRALPSMPPPLIPRSSP